DEIIELVRENNEVEIPQPTVEEKLKSDLVVRVMLSFVLLAVIFYLIFSIWKKMGKGKAKSKKHLSL
ncbi:MAG: hypothetical protein PHF67_01140, partial [Candidatus Nanoarchaeia archaeon]|nr:hypothetical protein [Candidatus Nanoarchaeia archaeon]